MMYMSAFFKTLDDANEFRKKNGGIIYKFTARVNKVTGMNDYKIEAFMRGMSEDEMQEKPYCVAWNQK